MRLTNRRLVVTGGALAALLLGCWALGLYPANSAEGDRDRASREEGADPAKRREERSVVDRQVTARLDVQQSLQSRRIAELEERIAALQANQAAPERSAPSATEERPSTGRAKPGRHESQGLTGAALRTTFQDAFDAEEVDPAWSPTQQTRVQEAITRFDPEVQGAAVKVTAIECRSTMCRSVIDTGTEPNALPTLLLRPELANGSLYFPDETGNGMVLFSFREGKRAEVNELYKVAYAAAIQARDSSE